MEDKKYNLGKYIARLFNEGWRVEATSCACGGNWAWLRETNRGTLKMFGCVCHNVPYDEFK